ncbi:hypothetical protein T492DRAFT_894102 [Pavlovales sp. CCMP2436]|nr:hypothetical protein T492DRAFT_894102 [Pavlovales sp. CCMP2436]
MLYDFPSLCADKANTRYLLDAPTCFGAVSGGREWTRATFSQSFRLTPNIAAFVNTFWDRGELIVGANSRAPNKKVNYYCMNPYSRDLAQLIQHSIREYGAEAVLLIGQSTKARTPLTRQSNLISTPVYLNDGTGGGGTAEELAKKSPILTACRSKGCEFKCVWFIGFHNYNVELMMSVNQVCVGFSCASVELNVVQAEHKHIYPIGGKLARMGESYERLRQLARDGVISLVACPAILQISTLLSTPRETVHVSNCTRICARDLREVQRALSSGIRIDAVKVDKRKQQYKTVRSVRSLHYEVSDIYGDALRMYLQAMRGIAPPELIGSIFAACPMGKAFSYEGIYLALRRDGVMVSVDFTPFEGKRERAELALLLRGCLSRAGEAVSLMGACDLELCLIYATAAAWLYMAASRKAFIGYRNRFQHMGTTVGSYEWRADELFEETLRVYELVVPPGGVFEYALSYVPADAKMMKLSGRADWIDDVSGTLVELKFCSALSEEHRLQTLIYGAMLAAQLGRDVKAVLFNARTGSREVYTVAQSTLSVAGAVKFALSLSVVGAAALGAALTVAATLSVAGATKLSALTVAGSLTAADVSMSSLSTSTLNTSSLNASSLTSYTVKAISTLSVDDALCVDGTCTMRKTLSVSGVATLAAALVVGTTLSVGGATKLTQVTVGGSLVAVDVSASTLATSSTLSVPDEGFQKVSSQLACP